MRCICLSGRNPGTSGFVGLPPNGLPDGRAGEVDHEAIEEHEGGISPHRGGTNKDPWRGTCCGVTLSETEKPQHVGLLFVRLFQLTLVD